MSDQHSKQNYPKRDFLAEIESLKAENATLRSELSAYKEGIAVEDADKEGIYAIKYRDHWIDVRYEHDGWYVFDQEFQEWAQVYPTRLYPLPHQQKGGKDE